jgi:hypothetical protein
MQEWSIKMIDQPSSVGFIGTLAEIIIHYQIKFCREHSIPDNRHHNVVALVDGVRIKYIECKGTYPLYGYPESQLGKKYILYNNNGPKMVDNTGGHHNPDNQYIFEVIEDKEHLH